MFISTRKQLLLGFDNMCDRFRTIDGLSTHYVICYKKNLFITDLQVKMYKHVVIAVCNKPRMPMLQRRQNIMGTILLQHLHTTETYAHIKLFRKVLTPQIKFNTTLPFRCLVLMVPVFTKLFRIRI